MEWAYCLVSFRFDAETVNQISARYGLFDYGSVVHGYLFNVIELLPPRLVVKPLVTFRCEYLHDALSGTALIAEHPFHAVADVYFVHLVQQSPPRHGRILTFPCRHITERSDITAALDKENQFYAAQMRSSHLVPKP